LPNLKLLSPLLKKEPRGRPPTQAMSQFLKIKFDKVSSQETGRKQNNIVWEKSEFLGGKERPAVGEGEGFQIQQGPPISGKERRPISQLLGPGAEPHCTFS